MIPHSKTVDEDLNEAAREVMVGTLISGFLELEK